jgi:Arc/MetJ family transcription regulator
MKTLFGSQPNPQLAALEASMKSYAALITITGVRVSTALSIKAIERQALELDGKKNIVGVVLPRFCTERSMRAEAERMHDALFGSSPVKSVEEFASRAIFGGYDAIGEAIHDIVRTASIAHENAQTRAAEIARRQKDGQTHLAQLFGRNERERRKIVATYF